MKYRQSLYVSILMALMGLYCFYAVYVDVFGRGSLTGVESVMGLIIALVTGYAVYRDQNSFGKGRYAKASDREITDEERRMAVSDLPNLKKVYGKKEIDQG